MVHGSPLSTRRHWLRLAGLGVLMLASRELRAEISAESRASLALREWHGAFGGSTEKSLRVISRAADWKRIWRGFDKPEPANFIEGSLGAVFAGLGSRPSGGFGISAIGAEIRSDRVRLEFAETKPAKDEFVIEALTQPWAVFLLEARGRALDASWTDA